MEIRMLAAKLRVQITVLVQSLTAQKKRLSVLQLYELCRFGYIKLIFSSAGRRKRRKIEIRMLAANQPTSSNSFFSKRHSWKSKTVRYSPCWTVSVGLHKVNFQLSLSTETTKNGNPYVSSQATSSNNSFGSKPHSSKKKTVRSSALWAVSVWLHKVNFQFSRSTETTKNRNPYVSNQATVSINSLGSKLHSSKQKTVFFSFLSCVGLAT